MYCCTFVEIILYTKIVLDELLNQKNDNSYIQSTLERSHESFYNKWNVTPSILGGRWKWNVTSSALFEMIIYEPSLCTNVMPSLQNMSERIN